MRHTTTNLIDLFINIFTRHPASTLPTQQNAKFDCSNEELRESILQSAIDKGNETLRACKSNASMSTPEISSTTLCQSSSSSSVGETSEDLDRHPSNEDCNITQRAMNTSPQPMTTQVGGIAKHKRPMMMMDQLILKPLRFVYARSLDNFDTRDNGNEAENDGENRRLKMNGVKNNMSDFRGIREVAFYQSLELASSISLSSWSQRVGDKVPAYYVDRTPASWVLMCLLSLCKNGASASEGVGMQQLSHTHFLNVSKLSYFDTIILLSAYLAGDYVVVSRVQSYARAWYALVNELDALKQLSQFTAAYFGMAHCFEGVERGHNRYPPIEQPHLLLQNLIVPFRQPNIIDIKMGTRTYEPSAQLLKQVSQAAKYPQQFVLGFRIVGMGMHMPDGSYRFLDKSFGVSLKTREDVIAALMSFFQCDDASTNKTYIRCIIASVIQQLNQIRNWFEVANSSLAFYASSILLAYESGVQVDDVVFSTLKGPIVKMIDFAHVCHHTGGDCGYLKGLRSLLKILHDIQRRIS